MTIGVGHNLDAQGLCKEAIAAQLRFDIEQGASLLDIHLAWWRSTPPAVQRALLNLVFNLGISSLLTFTTFLGLLQARSWDAAAQDLLGTKYAAQVGPRAVRVAKLIQSVV